MIAQTKPAISIILYEGPGSVPLSAEKRVELARAVLESGYEMQATGTAGEVELDRSAHVLVMGAFEAEPPLQSQQQEIDAQLVFFDVTEADAEAVGQRLDRLREETDTPMPGQWKPWFPAIDYDRCTNCLQCLSFCLFDVYGVSEEGSIQVQNPDKCKTDCPACSRVCPEVAIVFPKYKGGPINGAEVSEDDMRREKMKVDISSLLGGDVYATLRDRNAKAKSRFSKERDEDRALKERKRCMAKLKQQFDDLDIPPEVLSSLPSMDQIKAKAEEVKQRAKQYQDASDQSNNS